MKYEIKHTQEMIDVLGKTTLVIAMEEMAELQQQTSKMIRGKPDFVGIAEEIADVLIGIDLIMAQANISEETIQYWIDKKTTRTRDRITKGEFK